MMNTATNGNARASRLRIVWHVIAATAIIALIGWRFGAGFVTRETEETFPARPIEVIVPYDAGGGTDTLARLVQRAISRKDLLSQPMVILNLPGGGATIGSRHVKNSKPDGYRILCLDEGIMTSKLSGMVPFGAEAFEPIAQSTENTTVVVVRDDSPFRDLPSLLAAAKTNPQSVRFGVPLGTPPHFSGKTLQRALPGAEFNFIQSMGGQKRYSLLLGHHIDVAIFSLAETLAYRAAPGTVPEKQIRPLGVLSAQRHPLLPETLSATEQGLDVVAGNALYWWAPRGTPQERIDILADAIGSAMATPALQEEMRALAIDPRFRRGEALTNWINERTRKLSEVAFDPEIKLPNFPLYLGALVAALGAAMLVVSARRRKSAEATPDFDSHGRAAAFCAMILIGYVILLSSVVIPYAIATAAMVFLVGGMIASWRRSRLVILAEIALLTGFGAEMFFTQVFSVVLP